MGFWKSQVPVTGAFDVDGFPGLPLVYPTSAAWNQIYLLELLDVSPVRNTHWALGVGVGLV